MTKTGNGKPRIDWGDHNIDGVPGLMVMGEYEWWEDRITPAFEFMAKHPKTPLAFLADAGHGHFDYSDEMVFFLAMFIRKAAAALNTPPTIATSMRGFWPVIPATANTRAWCNKRASVSGPTRPVPTNTSHFRKSPSRKPARNR
jgi:hypothetical protein